jgi:hypothetical protein
MLVNRTRYAALSELVCKRPDLDAGLAPADLRARVESLTHDLSEELAGLIRADRVLCDNSTKGTV